MRRRIAFLLVLAFAGTVLALAGGATAEPGPVTVVVNPADAILDPNSTQCVPEGTYPACTSTWDGGGVTVGGPRLWLLTLTITGHGRPGQWETGTWRLTAADGSGDGLSGELLTYNSQPYRMEVTAGQGAYAGYLDAVSGGQTQNFQAVTVSDPTNWYGSVRAGSVLAGSLRFDLQPPA